MGDNKASVRYVLIVNRETTVLTVLGAAAVAGSGTAVWFISRERVDPAVTVAAVMNLVVGACLTVLGRPIGLVCLAAGVGLAVLRLRSWLHARRNT